jgi:Xaa-Pro aminopeptidase
MSRVEKIASMLNKEGYDAVLLTGDANCKYVTEYSSFGGIVFITKNGECICLTNEIYIEDANINIEHLGYSIRLSTGNFFVDNYFYDINNLVKKYGVTRLGFEETLMPVALYEKYTDVVKSDFIPIGNRLDRIRAIKEPWEAEQILVAQRITEKAVTEMLNFIKLGARERDLCIELEHRMVKYGATRPSFPTILLSGLKTSQPHGIANDKKIAKGEFVIIDCGAVVNGYCSDMTRTYAIGHATDEMHYFYEVVLNAQLTGIETFDVGRTGGEVFMSAERILSGEGYPNKLLSLGHGIGIDVHEYPGPKKDSEAIFEQGMICTIEPGIYIPGKFGIRIEDMIYLSPNGKVNLTNLTNKLIIL